MISNKNPSSRLKSDVKGKLKQSTACLTGSRVFFKQLNLTSSEYTELQSPTAYCPTQSCLQHVWPKYHRAEFLVRSQSPSQTAGPFLSAFNWKGRWFSGRWWPSPHLSSSHWLGFWHFSCSHCDQTAASYECWVHVATKPNIRRNVRLQLCPQWHTWTPKVTAGQGRFCTIPLKMSLQRTQANLYSLSDSGAIGGVPHRKRSLHSVSQRGFSNKPYPGPDPRPPLTLPSVLQSHNHIGRRRTHCREVFSFCCSRTLRITLRTHNPRWAISITSCMTTFNLRLLMMKYFLTMCFKDNCHYFLPSGPTPATTYFYIHNTLCSLPFMFVLDNHVTIHRVLACN